MSVYVGLISCEDRAGLVHRLTGVLFNGAVNVTENQEFVDHETKRFFMRTQFEGNIDPQAVTAQLAALLPSGAFCEVRELKPRRLVLLASREPHCLGDLLLRNFTGELRANILAVISPDSECRDLTERFGLPFHLLPIEKDRTAHERKILEVINQYSPDYLVLARFMRILSADFIRHFPQKILNIHHSFLPAFIGKDPYVQAYARGVKIIGATAHIVTEKLDEGPIVTQDVIRVDHTCSPQTMARRGQDVEKVVLARGLLYLLEDRVLIDGNRTIVFE